MNLTYRGISFASPITGAPAIETEQTATFLGQTYRVKQAPLSPSTAHEELTYRGVRYSR